jgi:glyoxylase-like metal-dependent hydrolase (beta-lactamase superfamily II)
MFAFGRAAPIGQNQAIPQNKGMDRPIEIAADLAYIRTSIANVYFAGSRHSWVLMDTGIPGYADRIRKAAAHRFGETSKPHAIVLTHGHFDHAAGALELARYWGVSVYAHPLEFPYLTGQSAYPQKDPTVGGAMAFLSRFFPSRTVNIAEVLRDLPETGEVPGLDGWMAVFTPGHAPGHVSFWREVDGTLVGGDVVATADLDSWYGLISQKQRISRPASPITYDWEKARRSVRTIANLNPRVLACGHGEPMKGESVAAELETFAREFTPPASGRYIASPAEANEHGVVYEPPKPPDPLPKIGAGIVAGIFLLAGIVYSRRGKKAAAEIHGLR